MPNPPLIPLIIVTGAPGSGKSTLARRLAGDLRLPLLMKDELKEALYDVFGSPDPAASRQVAQGAYTVLWCVVGRLLNAGCGLVLESNFYVGFSEIALAPFVARASTVQLQCGGDPEVISQRYRERAERGERHPGHHDHAALPRLRDGLANGSFEPLALDIPTLRVDTTGATEYEPGYDEILRFIGEGISR